MTDLEKYQECVRLAKEAFEFVLLCANDERKALKAKDVNGHYVKALNELKAIKEQAQAKVSRYEKTHLDTTV